MERFVASAPQPRELQGHPPSVSPLSASSLASATSVALPSIPFSAIESVSSATNSDSDLIPPPSEDILSERGLIGRGRVLLQAYQTQKKLWLQTNNSDYDSREVQDVQPILTSNVEYSKTEYSSPVKQAVAHLATPSIDTRLKEVPPPLPPSSMMSGLSGFSIGPLPASELKMNQPLSGNRSEKSWAEFMQLLKTNGRTMDVVDAQLAEIWGELVSADEKVRGTQMSVDKLSEAVTQLLQQKREAEIAIAKLAEVLGSRVFLTGKMGDDAVQFVSNQLKLELETSQTLVEKVKAEKISYKKEEVVRISANGDAGAAEVEKLQQRLEEKEEQLEASHAIVAKLKAHLAQQKESAADRHAQFERALDVKLREIDMLCCDVDLPMDYERIKTAEGVACYRRTDNTVDNELEDPRVPIVIQQRSAAASAATSAGDVSTSHEIVSSGRSHRPRGVSAMVRDYAAPDNVLRRSFSTPHISHDSSVFEDIHIPPDDGRKHKIEDFSTPLPTGWEMRVTATGAVFFFNKYTTSTTWTDPRLLRAASASSPVDNAPREQKPVIRNPTSSTVESRPSRSNSTAVNADPPQFIPREEEDDVKYVDVVFEERGSIGIHFQANVPDAGATVRNLLPDMAAAKKGVLEPYDELVAVNKTAVDFAPFRHVMILLQGGLRPLTLTFKRDPNRPQHPMSPLPAAPSSDGGISLASISESSDTHLDEEVVIDEGTVVDLEELRVPQVYPSEDNSAQTGDDGDDEEDMSMADHIITNIFSLFWRSPETTGEVHTV